MRIKLLASGGVLHAYVVEVVETIGVAVAQPLDGKAYAAIDLHYSSPILEQVVWLAQEFEKRDIIPTVHFVEQGSGFYIIVMFRMKSIEESLLRQIVASDDLVLVQDLVRAGKTDFIMTAEAEFNHQDVYQAFIEKFESDGFAVLSIGQKVQQDVTYTCWKTEVRTISNEEPNG